MGERSSNLTLPSGKAVGFFSKGDRDFLSGLAGGGGPTPTAYRYVRLLQTESQPSGYVELQRCDYFDPDGAYCHAAMTGVTSPSPLVASASENLGDSYRDWMAFSRSVSDRWHTNTPSTAEWLKIDMGAGNEKVIAGVGISYNNTSRYFPKFDIQGSNTGAFAGEEDTLWESPTFISTSFRAISQYRVFWFDKDYSAIPVA